MVLLLLVLDLAPGSQLHLLFRPNTLSTTSPSSLALRLVVFDGFPERGEDVTVRLGVGLTGSVAGESAG